MGALLKLFGFTPSALLVDLIYAGIVAGILGGFGLWVHKCHSAEDALKSIAAQSKVLLDAANAKIKTDAADHATALAANKVIYETELKDNSAQHTADLERLRKLDAYRKAHPDVARAAEGSGGSTGGDGSAGKSDLSFAGLGNMAAGLSDALRDSVTALDTCTRERDSLVGKP